jgi:hypothetical protein
MNKDSNLSAWGKNIFSQTGEDGILEKVFEIIGTSNKWCVEFGAWDGEHYSNTAHLVQNKGWSGIFIEADQERFQELKATYTDLSRVIAINTFVQFEGRDRIDAILKNTPIPKDFDLISIDIDGNDYHIWDSLKMYQPRVVIIEINPTIPADVDFVQPKDMRITQGSSLLAMSRLGNKQGYQLVAVTELNAIFVRNEYYRLFGITDNSPQALKNTDHEMRLFQLYDGTLVLKGLNRLLWHHVDIKQKNIQLVPRLFRTFPDNMNVLVSYLFKIWRKIHNKL